ncbi:Retrovirus-related Pol polyprotein from transposon 17.6 [Vitis vinifera]|uniref:Retrovirus-related Pol polyprotein from transposon 17.6 n=1 Tax=Vitis vinifera TaxID=29760 RepID=A0A438FRB0_VITVI|nr:Retrovirus-related Pol polyprotein from transposon 17.6 [Vitis vinifera]
MAELPLHIIENILLRLPVKSLIRFRQCNRLPPNPNVVDFVACHGFGYDSFADDYKVVVVSMLDPDLETMLDVFSLKSNKWKRILEKTSYYGCVHFRELAMPRGEGPIIGIRATMTTNKERIEILEQGVGGLQDEVQRLGLGMNDRMQRLEESLKALSDVVLSSKAAQPSHSSHSVKQGHTPQYQHEETESSRLNIPPLRTKIEFPRFAGDDPTEWFNRVAQFFEFQRTPEDQKVSLAAFHMEGEANQWWQWLNRTYKELEYLGHIVTNHGVKVDGKKIEAMIAWPQPTTITELRGFLGLTGYYRKFVRNYGVLARPLTNLLKKGNFKWDEDAAAAFTMLKQALTTTPTLAMPNFNEPFTIETDASGDGIGAVLTQQGRPIAYMSRALGVTKRSWSIYAKEMLAIVEAIRTWRPYILGRKFFIRTDQRSLKYFLEQRVATSEQQKWVAKLLGYDYEIIYRPGKENSAADALSRRPNSPFLNPIFISQVSLWDDIRKAAATDLYMKKIFQQAAHDPTGHYVVKNGLCFYKQRVVVPTALRGQLLQEFHDSKVVGHSGVLRTFKRLAQQFYWPSILIEQKLGKVAYRLSLPPEAKIHPVFHVSLLKKYVGTSLPALVDLPPISDEGQLQVTPEKVVNTRWIKRGTKFIEESLVQWKNLPVEDATWEDTQMLKHQFSTLNLEDKGPINMKLRVVGGCLCVHGYDDPSKMCSYGVDTSWE